MKKPPIEFALVTGASGGIGECMARRLAAQKQPLLLAARSKEKLEALARALAEANGIECHALAADLSDPEGTASVSERAAKQGWTVGTLINNAGFTTYGDFHARSLSDHLECLRLNCEAIVRLTHAFLPDMLERRRGAILNVASTAGFVPTPHMSLYGATKAFVLSFSEGLWAEVKDRGVRVCALCPGPVKTGFQKRARMGEMMDDVPFIWLDADKVAAIGLEALQRGRPVAVAGAVNRLQVLTAKLSPRSWVARLSERAMRGLEKPS